MPTTAILFDAHHGHSILVFDALHDILFDAHHAHSPTMPVLFDAHHISLFDAHNVILFDALHDILFDAHYVILQWPFYLMPAMLVLWASSRMVWCVGIK